MVVFREPAMKAAVECSLEMVGPTIRVSLIARYLHCAI
jgi:hypothetical protein